MAITRRDHKQKPLVRSTLLACGLLGLTGTALAAPVLDIDFSEAALLTPDPLIEGVQFFAGDGALFEDTITDDAANPGNPYLVSGVEESAGTNGTIDIPGLTQTSFIGASLASLGGAGLTTLIELNAGFFATLPVGETIRAEARLGGVVQGSDEATTDTPDLQALSISLDELAFDTLYIYVSSSDFGAAFRIDDLGVDVTTKGPPPVPVPGTLLLLGAGIIGARLATGRRGNR